MCGIAGCLFHEPTRGLVPYVAGMCDALSHRGPDDSGVWHDEQIGVALAHRRLSVLDLSPLGHQPMRSACRRYVISFNGEIYNHLELRAQLGRKGHTFTGSSDTETILAAVSEWGVTAAVERFVGMFAMALWDRHERALYLVRDRMGIKPLFYGNIGKNFVFASELKAISALPDFEHSIDRDVLSLFFRHNYVPTPYCIYSGLHKLEPGTILTVSLDAGIIRSHRYWSAEDKWLYGIENGFLGTEEEAVDRLDSLIRDAVGCRMLADVPIGAFLSGGIDSSTVVAVMQALSPTPVRTFTIGFLETSHNEASDARAIASHLGTEHTELFVGPKDLLELIPRIPHIWDEPFSDPSQVPVQLLSQLTRRHVTVSLSGDGGDELFAGYTRYFEGERYGRFLAIPHVLRQILGVIASTGVAGERNARRLNALSVKRFSELYRYMVSHNKQPNSLVLGSKEPATVYSGHAGDDWSDRIHQMSWLDAATYLPDDILTKLDRASMSVSLEARVPLIDHRVVEFAATLPREMKIKRNTGKWVLRKVLERYVPTQLTDRPKQGFGIPIASWLRNDFKEWAGDMLSPDTLVAQGYLDAGLVADMWKRHLSGDEDLSYYIWDILIFQAWMDTWQ